MATISLHCIEIAGEHIGALERLIDCIEAEMQKRGLAGKIIVKSFIYEPIKFEGKSRNIQILVPSSIGVWAWEMLEVMAEYGSDEEFQFLMRVWIVSQGEK